MNETQYDCVPFLTVAFAEMPPPMSAASLRIYGTFMVLFTSAVAIGNFLTIYVVAKVPILHKRINVYIVSLAFADLLIAVTVMPLQVYEAWNRKWDLPVELCYMRNIFDFSLVHVSVYNLTVLTTDRYLAICHPFLYVRINRILTGAIVASCWIIPFSIITLYILEDWNVIGYYEEQLCLFQAGLCPLNISDFGLDISMSFGTIVSFIMAFMYGKIYITAKRHFRAIQVLNVTEESRKKNKAFTSGTKAAKTLAIVVGCFYICWLPNSFLAIFISFTKNDYISPLVMQSLSWLSYTNSMMNPILYYIFSQDFKVAFKTIFHCKMATEDVSIVTVS